MKARCSYIFLLLSFLSIAAVAQQKLFTLLPPSETGVQFRNDIIEHPGMYYYLYEYLYNGAGVSIGDINNDGLPDIYFSSNTASNKLYLNKGGFKFEDITDRAGVGAQAGYKTGVNMVDINSDGWLDIVVCRSAIPDPKQRRKLVFINNGNGTFTDRAAEMGLADESYSTQSYFFDFDKDSDLDVFFVNHPSDFNTSMLINVKQQNGKLVLVKDTQTVYVSHRLYENRSGKFFDITKKAGLLSYAFGLSAVVSDFNNDGWPDMYVANDMKMPDQLWINNRNGTFSDRLADYFSHTSLFSMGSDLSDINNDGFEDLIVLDMAIENPVRQKQLFMHNLNYDKVQLFRRYGLFIQHARNVLQLNNGNGTFSDIANYAGVAQTDWSWTPLVADFDNDGRKDMYITNGLKRDITDWDYKVFVLDSIKNLMAKGQSVDLLEWFKRIPQVKTKNYFYHNNGALKFDNYSEQWCDQPPSFSNGAAYADLDNDGDLDIVVNNIDDAAFVLKNNSRELNQSDFIRFKILKRPGSNEEVTGAIVKIYNAGSGVQMQRFDPQRGYLGSTEHYVHFGIGNEHNIKKAEIIFPSGKQVVMENVTANNVITVYEQNAIAIPNETAITKKIFSKQDSKKIFPYTHSENDFIDFKREPLIPYKCSRKGPYYTKADVNGDGLEDIFICGAAGFEGKLMVQQPGGSFTEKKQAMFTADKNYEDAGVLFFDADGDGDKDLYVTSGGAEFDAGSARYQDRLYINDGNGNFKKSVTALPKENYNGSCVVALDFDNDGDNDLLVGGGVLPGKFPQHDRSMLLQNDKGIFKDVTSMFAENINSITGIINDAVWQDIDGDKKNELLLVGEWMPPVILKWAEGRFSKENYRLQINSFPGRTFTLDDLTGWWNTIKTADVDNDGDMDILLGNRGGNSRIKASMDEPCTVYAKDFDGNGSYDAVLGYYIWGKCYPMFHRDQLIDQMPFMRKKFIRYNQFAGKTMDEIFSEEQKKDMQVFKTGCFESGVLINDGNNLFRFEAFPEMAQLSNINDMLVDDFDKDGFADVLVCGNSEDPDVSTGNYDAMAAVLLKGTGGGKFIAVRNNESGLPVKGELRRIITTDEKTKIIFLKNSGQAELYRVN